MSLDNPQLIPRTNIDDNNVGSLLAGYRACIGNEERHPLSIGMSKTDEFGPQYNSNKDDVNRTPQI